MDHQRLEPLKGKSGREPTNVTKMTIKELLAQEGVEFKDVAIESKAPDQPLKAPQRVHDHKALQPLERGPAQVQPTAVTFKTIAELLAEEGVSQSDMPLMQAKPKPDAD
ncbi:hypothetical protein C8N43_0162 [Litoreibacter ponti]|uniref:Uncharacterized protein n=1 Tax=Litoreibacter ponti TaxID=1510457 RepID=A0A2T6BHH3_9RHOB|nr:hypothetical protein [Litoreibacter ponti]PTX55523.1 hypothetical protein C8N43_0162 [Litoreibacter ponti]